MTLARARAAAGPSLAVRVPDHVRLVEVEAAPDDVARFIDGEFDRGGHGRPSLVLDLPLGLFRGEALRDRLDASVVTVGASPLDERLAASVLAQPEAPASLLPPNARSPWLLGCDRPDYTSAALRFERAIREAVSGRRDGCPGARFLPATLPTPSPTEAASLLEGMPDEAALRRGHRLLASLMPDAGTPAEGVGLNEALASRPAPPDRRGSSERLRDLADALDAMSSGRAPSAEALVDAPLLEDWSIEPRSVPSLTGHVTGHPDIGRGQWVVTSEIYATDGRSWARTYSRYYRLGRPAGAGPPPKVH